MKIVTTEQVDAALIEMLIDDQIEQSRRDAIIAADAFKRGILVQPTSDEIREYVRGELVKDGK